MNSGNFSFSSFRLYTPQNRHLGIALRYNVVGQLKSITRPGPHCYAIKRINVNVPFPAAHSFHPSKQLRRPLYRKLAASFFDIISIFAPIPYVFQFPTVSSFKRVIICWNSASTASSLVERFASCTGMRLNDNGIFFAHVYFPRNYSSNAHLSESFAIPTLNDAQVSSVYNFFFTSMLPL